MSQVVQVNQFLLYLFFLLENHFLLAINLIDGYNSEF